jgi:methyl-accepting chemotaxis protein
MVYLFVPEVAILSFLLGVMTPDNVYELVETRTQRTFLMLVVLCFLVIIMILVKIYETRRVMNAIASMSKIGENVARKLAMSEEHGRITDDGKQKITTARNEIAQVVTSASVKAGQAAEKADQVSQATKDVIQRLSSEQAQMKVELHQVASKLDRLVKKLCPEDDSIHERVEGL